MTARDRRDDPLRPRHPAEPSRCASRTSTDPTPYNTRESIRGCRRRRSRTPGSPRCRRPLIRRRSTTSSSSASRTRCTTSSRRSRARVHRTDLTTPDGRPARRADRRSPSRTRCRRGCRTPPSRRSGSTGPTWRTTWSGSGSRRRSRGLAAARLRGRERDDAAQARTVAASPGRASESVNTLVFERGAIRGHSAPTRRSSRASGTSRPADRRRRRRGRRLSRRACPARAVFSRRGEWPPETAGARPRRQRDFGEGRDRRAGRPGSDARRPALPGDRRRPSAAQSRRRRASSGRARGARRAGRGLVRALDGRAGAGRGDAARRRLVGVTLTSRQPVSPTARRSSGS